MKSYSSLLLAAMLMATASQLAQAEEVVDEHPYLTDEFFIDLGVFFPDRRIGIQVNSSITGPSEPIDFEADIGTSETDEVFSFNFGWRFGEKWQLEGQYFESNGSRGAALEEDVEWEDVVFLAGTGVKAGQDFALFRTFFARRFESHERHEFGLGAGLHWVKLGAYIEGSLRTAGGVTRFGRESVEVLAPLPNLGVWYMYSISPKWALKTRLDWLDVSIQEYDGSLTNVSFGLNYKIFENAGLGLNYNAFDLNLDMTRNSWRGKAELSYEGLFAYLSFYW